MQLAPKYCPQCRSEFVHQMTTCSDCGVALVAEEPAPESEDPSGVLRSAEGLQLLRAAELAWAQALAERLGAAGIGHRVELLDPAGRARGEGRARPGWQLRYGVFVRPEDVARAAAIDAALLRSQIPDLPEGAAGENAEGELCPACGSPVDADALECGECGLGFAPGDESA